MNIVADASPMIALAILKQLDLLARLFSSVLVPEAVFAEATALDKPHAETIRQFAQDKIAVVENHLAVQMLMHDVDRGEAEAIVLALEKDISEILIDDAKGRRVARLNGLHPVGTIGVLLQAKKTKLVSEIKPLLDTLMANRIRISDQLYEQALKLADEGAE